MTVFVIHAIKLIIEIIKMLIIFYMFTGYTITNKKKKKYIALVIYLISNAIVYINPLANTNDITVIITLSVMVIILIIFEGKAIKKIMTFIVLYLVVCIFDMFFDNLAWLIYSTGVEDYFAYIIRIVSSEVTSLVLLMVICIFIIKKEIIVIFSIKSYLMLIFCSFMLSGFIAYSRFILINNDESIFLILNILFSIMWLIFLITIFLFINTQIEKEKYKTEIKINQEINKGKEEYYKMISEKNNMLLGFRHDYSEHMKILKMLILKEDNVKAKEYINEILKHSKLTTLKAKTGNIIINAIVSDCLNKFKNEKIEFTCEGKFPDVVSINGMDMCTIFSNVIINSFEAASKFNGNKYVSMKVKKLNENYIITIKNPNEKIVDKNKFLKISSKQKTENHGIGIKNVRKVLETYKGLLDFEVFGNEVETKILVKL